MFRFKTCTIKAATAHVAIAISQIWNCSTSTVVLCRGLVHGKWWAHCTSWPHQAPVLVPTGVVNLVRCVRVVEIYSEQAENCITQSTRCSGAVNQARRQPRRQARQQDRREARREARCWCYVVPTGVQSGAKGSCAQLERSGTKALILWNIQRGYNRLNFMYARSRIQDLLNRIYKTSVD